MSDDRSGEVSRRTVLKRAGAAGAAATGLGAVGGTAAAASAEEVADEVTDVSGIASLVAAQVGTETKTECEPHSDCSCTERKVHDSPFGEDYYVSAELRSVTYTKVPYLGIWVPTSLGSCGCGRTGDLERCP